MVCSPEGLTFRPKVSGSITQSELKAKLQAKLEADPTLEIDVNRELKTSDLSISDLTASIAIELPKVWNERFQTKAGFKRVNKTTVESDESASAGASDDNSGTSNSGSTETPVTPENPSGSDTGGNTGGNGGDDDDDGVIS